MSFHGSIDLRKLMKASRTNVERLARWLKLKFNSDWSHKHLSQTEVCSDFVSQASSMAYLSERR